MKMYTGCAWPRKHHCLFKVFLEQMTLKRKGRPLLTFPNRNSIRREFYTLYFPGFESKQPPMQENRSHLCPGGIPEIDHINHLSVYTSVVIPTVGLPYSHPSLELLHLPKRKPCSMKHELPTSFHKQPANHHSTFCLTIPDSSRKWTRLTRSGLFVTGLFHFAKCPQSSSTV